MKSAPDAPPHYDLAAAEAWASGYEAAQERIAELTGLLRKVLGCPMAAPWLEADGTYSAIRKAIEE